MRRTPCNLVNPKKREWQEREQRRRREIEEAFAAHTTPQERELRRRGRIHIYS